jgi:hypothetical protein
VDLFARLNKIAVENNADFCDLVEYALTPKTPDKPSE